MDELGTIYACDFAFSFFLDSHRVGGCGMSVHDGLSVCLDAAEIIEVCVLVEHLEWTSPWGRVRRARELFSLQLKSDASIPDLHVGISSSNAVLLERKPALLGNGGDYDCGLERRPISHQETYGPPAATWPAATASSGVP